MPKKLFGGQASGNSLHRKDKKIWQEEHQVAAVVIPPITKEKKKPQKKEKLKATSDKQVIA